MAKETKLNTRIISITLDIMPLVAIAIFAFVIIRHGDFSVEEIASLIPPTPVLAVLIIVCIYAVKSMSIVIPLALLYVSVGYVYSSPWAIILNMIGQVSSLTVPYLIGRVSGTGLADFFIEKYEKMDELKKLQSNNEYLTSYLLRMIGILPGDVVSLYLGNIKMKYKSYLTGSMLGLLPRMIAFTLLGTTGFDIDSIMFWVMVIINIILVIVPIMYKRRLTAKGE